MTAKRENIAFVELSLSCDTRTQFSQLPTCVLSEQRTVATTGPASLEDRLRFYAYCSWHASHFYYLGTECRQ